MKIMIVISQALIIFLMMTSSGCTEKDEAEEQQDYFSETYSKAPLDFRFETNLSDNNSHVIIPVAMQNNRYLNLSEFQTMSDYANFSYTIVDTNYGKGVKISPIPQGEFTIWFDTDQYTVTGPFQIQQNVQYYQSNYPGLSTWETDGEHGYYWFYCSENVTELSFRFEYSDCYFFSDSAMISDLGSDGWIRVQFQRTQMDMEM